jgi:hypothetical protein
LSQYPRTVLADTQVTWGGETVFVRKGTVADIKPGSRLEQAYGGSANLSAVLAPAQRGDEPDADHAGISN